MAAKKQKESLIDMTKFVELVYNRSIDWGKKYDLYPKGEKAPKEKYSDKAKKFDSILSKANFGCQEPHVRALIEELLGEELPQSKKKPEFVLEFSFGTVVVVLSDPQGKGLPVGEPVLIKNNKGEIITKEGSHLVLPAQSPKALRLPTISEVEDILESIMNRSDSAMLMAAYFLQKTEE